MDASSPPPMRRVDIRCMCGLLGRLYFTGEVKDGKDVCQFKCSCDSPKPNLEDPYAGL